VDGGDRVPGGNRGAGVQAAQARGRVAVHQDAVTDGVAPLRVHGQRASKTRQRRRATDLERLHVGRNQLFLALELLFEERLDEAVSMPSSADSTPT